MSCKWNHAVIFLFFSWLLSLSIEYLLCAPVHNPTFHPSQRVINCIWIIASSSLTFPALSVFCLICVINPNLVLHPQLPQWFSNSVGNQTRWVHVCVVEFAACFPRRLWVIEIGNAHVGFYSYYLTTYICCPFCNGLTSWHSNDSARHYIKPFP